MTLRTIALAVILLLVGGKAHAGPSYTLGRKALCAELAVEVQLTIPVPASNGLHESAEVGSAQKFPTGLVERAMRTAKVTQTFFGTDGVQLPRNLNFYLPDRNWWTAQKNGKLRAILFLRRVRGLPEVLFGVEGVPSDSAPAYGEVRSAVQKYARWRRNPAEGANLVEAERLLHETKNIDSAYLVWDYLCSSNQTDAITRAANAGAASAAAKIYQHIQANRYPICSPPPDCSQW